MTSVEGVGEEGEVVLGHATLSLRYQAQTSPGGNPTTTGYPAGKLLVNIRVSGLLAHSKPLFIYSCKKLLKTLRSTKRGGGEGGGEGDNIPKVLNKI